MRCLVSNQVEFWGNGDMQDLHLVKIKKEVKKIYMLTTVMTTCTLQCFPSFLPAFRRTSPLIPKNEEVRKVRAVAQLNSLFFNHAITLYTRSRQAYVH